MEQGVLLHVGCGGAPIPEWANGRFTEVRLDVDATHSPDIVASMTAMGDIGQFDAIHCCHALEHLHAYEVDKALAEFLRVLKPGGYAVIFVPDLEDVKATEDVLYTAPCGPMAGLDLIYGLRTLVEHMPYMAHKTGFTSKTMTAVLQKAGFGGVHTRRLQEYNLMAIAIK